MIRRILLVLLALVVIGAIGFFALGPGIVERSMNKVEPGPMPTVTAETQALHKSLAIADLHADTLLWQRALDAPADRGQVDLARLKAGNVALQVFSSVTKTPKNQNYDSNPADTDNITLLAFAQLQPPATWSSLLERSLWHATKLRRVAGRSQRTLRIVRQPRDLDFVLAERAGGRDITGAMLSIEGLQNIEGRIENLDRLYEAGFRMAGFAHFFDNELAGSMHGERKGGLTPLGREVLRRMEAKGMIVDIAHASHAAVADMLAMARRPVVSSHGGVQATCPNTGGVNRNLTDAEIRGVARTGGVIGIGYWDAAICDTSPAAVARAIVHVRDLVGVEHVGLGSDFDGAVTTRFDTAQLEAVTQALKDAGLSDAEVRAVMGGNVLRLIRAGLAPQ